jgi:DNA-binding transcriptional MocR family regulator
MASSTIDFKALQSSASELERRFAALKDKKLALDMTRGKPCAAQLDLSNDLMTIVGPKDFGAADGTDTRNYGGIDGLPEAKTLFAEFMEVAPSEILIGDNSSLTLMHDTIARALSHGVPGGTAPWSRDKVRFVCPTPGYDRHFTVCQHFGIDMLLADMTDEGPDMNTVEQLASQDPTVKGIWIVPKYENPTGATCSPAVVERLARMKTVAPDFRVFWDNAYAHHHLTDSPPELANLLAECKAAGNADRVVIFGSTSKVSFAGAGIAIMAGSEANIAWMRMHRSKSTIGPDKINQLRHVRFFRDMDGIRAHMKKHAAILKPKFDTVDRVLSRELGSLGVANWTKPLGGYFVSLDTPDGCARGTVALAAELGVKFTEAGATFPHGKDPRDRNIRIAPTLPSLSEIEQAMEVLAVCIQRVALSKL